MKGKQSEPKGQRIQIQMQPRLVEFARTRLGDNPSEKNEIIRMIAPFVEYAPEDYYFKPRTGDDILTVNIWDKCFNIRTDKKTIYISENNQKVLAVTFRTYFNNRFFDYMDDKARYMKQIYKSPQIKKLIVQFCLDFNIPFNHINYESLKKSYYRRRQKKNLKKSVGSLSLSCPFILF